MQGIRDISTAEAASLQADGAAVFVDVRSVNSYNGWRFFGERREGHIRGARSLPAKWAKYLDWIEIVRSKGIMPGQRIVIYGADDQSINDVAATFQRNDYPELFAYRDFVGGWTVDDSLPMDRMERYSTLVSPEWVKAIVDGKTPAGHSGGRTVICHAHYRNREAYLSGHIPGAVDIDTLALESPETWNRRTPEELKQALEEHGITADTTVVLYGKFMNPRNEDEFPGSAAGHIAAIRCAFIMMYAGVKDVRVLNGGWQSWQDAGYEVSREDVPKEPVKDFGAKIPQQAALAVDVPEVKEMLASDDAAVVSVRSWREFIGEVSGYNYIEKTGRIPGAVFGNCGSDAYHMENYRNPDHTTREFGEVAETWREAGITSDKHLAFYCGTGWRGSEAFFNAWLMGYPRVSVFDGGWFEWSNDPANPYETGDPEESAGRAG